MSDFYNFSEFEDFDPDKAHNNPVPGRYHVKVIAVSKHGAKTDKLEIDFEIQAGKPAGNEGRTIRHFQGYPEQAADMKQKKGALGGLVRLALALNLTTKAEMEKVGGLRVDWNLALDRHCCIVVAANDKAKSGVSVDKVFGIDDPESADIPKNLVTLNKIGGDADPFSNPQNQPAAASAGDDVNLDDF